MNGCGSHLLLECDAVAPARLRDPEWLENTLLAAAEAAGATVLYGHFHHFGGAQGVTGVLLLRESHITIHTWPEFGYAAIDVFMCGQAQPRLAVDCLVRLLQPGRSRWKEVARGPLGTVTPGAA